MKNHGKKSRNYSPIEYYANDYLKYRSDLSHGASGVRSRLFLIARHYQLAISLRSFATVFLIATIRKASSKLFCFFST